MQRFFQLADPRLLLILDVVLVSHLLVDLENLLVYDICHRPLLLLILLQLVTLNIQVLHFVSAVCKLLFQLSLVICHFVALMIFLVHNCPQVLNLPFLVLQTLLLSLFSVLKLTLKLQFLIAQIVKLPLKSLEVSLEGLRFLNFHFVCYHQTIFHQVSRPHQFA